MAIYFSTPSVQLAPSVKTAVSLLVPAAILAGCSGPIKTRVSSAGEADLNPQGYMVPEKPSNASAEYSQAQKLLDDALAGQGFVLQEKAPLLLTFALSDRPAKVALRSGEKTIAAEKTKRLLQSCEDREYRLTLQLTKIASGEKLYDGEAAEYHCKATLAETLPAMVRILVDAIGSSQGSKALYRVGKD